MECCSIVTRRSIAGVSEHLARQLEQLINKIQRPLLFWMTLEPSWKGSKRYLDLTVSPVFEFSCRLLIPIAYPDAPNQPASNQTAFVPEYRFWGPDRDNRPEILFQFEEDEERRPRLQEAPCWRFHNGKVVLNPADKPIRDMKGLPLTLSSKTPAYKMEAIKRLNMNIENNDRR